MSTSEKHQDHHAAEAAAKMQIAIIGSALIVLVLVGIGFTSFNLGKKSSNNQTHATPVLDSSLTLGPRVLGTQEFSWNATVVRVNTADNVITAKVEVQQADGAVTTKEVSVRIGTATQLLLWDLTKPGTAGSSDGKDAIPLSQFSTGKRMIIRSAADISADNAIDAAVVSLLKTPLASY